MDSIPKPEVLDADRVLRDNREDMSAAEHRSQAQILDVALHQSCDYAEQLWSTLDSARGYLFSAVPPLLAAAGGETDWLDPGAPGEDPWQE